MVKRVDCSMREILGQRLVSVFCPVLLTNHRMAAQKENPAHIGAGLQGRIEMTESILLARC